ncbi:MAG: trimethylamine methyltransferase family protein [Spirochaetota bacterium]|nr:MAG: trimethylamine methyltransferase family protein [Spirochaetota bacterium]
MGLDFRAGDIRFMSPHFSLLSHSQIEDIHLASLEILERTGVRIDHPKVRTLLCDRGASVCEETNIVKIPPAIVESALRMAPRKVTIYDRSGKIKLRLEGRRVYFGAVSDIFYIIDQQTEKPVKCTRAHLPSILKVIDALENIEFVNPSGCVQEVPPEIANLISLKDALIGTTKPLIWEPRSLKELKQGISLCETVAGNRKNLCDKPFLIIYCEPISPLVHIKEALDCLFLAGEYRLPVIYTPMSIGGETAPVTLAGNLAICNAEALSGIVIAQTIREGLPSIYGGIPGPMDMHTAIFPYAAPESMLLCAALTEMAHYYNLPMFGTAGVTEAVEVDCQAASEITLNCILALLSGANLVHNVGLTAGGKEVSIEVMVLANEIIEMCSRSLQAIDTDKDLFALDVINTVGPGGNFITQDHTVKHCRKIWSPKLFQRMDIGKWLENPKHLSDRIHQNLQQIIEKHSPVQLEDKIIEQLKAMEEIWWREHD